MSQRQRNPFRLSIDGVELSELIAPRAKGQLNIGVKLAFSGLVSTYEEHLTRVDAGYTLSEWNSLGHMEKALEIALRRSSHKIDRIQSESSRKK